MFTTATHSQNCTEIGRKTAFFLFFFFSFSVLCVLSGLSTDMRSFPLLPHPSPSPFAFFGAGKPAALQPSRAVQPGELSPDVRGISTDFCQGNFFLPPPSVLLLCVPSTAAKDTGTRISVSFEGLDTESTILTLPHEEKLRVLFVTILICQAYTVL